MAIRPDPISFWKQRLAAASPAYYMNVNGEPSLDLCGSGGHRGGRGGAGSGSLQHAARRVAEPVAAIDALAGRAAVHCHHHHHVDGLDHAALEHDPEKLQTFRTRSCVETRNLSEMAIELNPISL